MSILLSLQGAIGQGILWGIMALGVYLTFRILDIADLSVDGSFATGGAVCAVALIAGMHPLIAILLATLSGFLAGFITGFLHTKCKMPAILSGILTQLALYSINLRIMGKSNIPLLQSSTLFKDLANVIPLTSQWITICIGLVFSFIVVAGIYWFLGTEFGSCLRATGNNENMEFPGYTKYEIKRKIFIFQEIYIPSINSKFYGKCNWEPKSKLPFLASVYAISSFLLFIILIKNQIQTLTKSAIWLMGILLFLFF